MPELPEVEQFRRLLCTLVSSSSPLVLELVGPKQPVLEPDEIEAINQGKHVVSNVLRKGKRLCLVLSKKDEKQHSRESLKENTSLDEQQENNDVHCCLYLHMGMTGRISTSDCLFELESLRKEDQSVGGPPAHTHLCLRAGDCVCWFSDPRRFGSVSIDNSNNVNMDDLAVDALEQTDASVFVGCRMAIKALLLDQKRAVSGVGNWVADEVLYHAAIHPLQTHLTHNQATRLLRAMHQILRTAIDNHPYPSEWLFHKRWGRHKNKKQVDAQGRPVLVLQAAGRTTLIVPSIQQLTPTTKNAADETTTTITTTTTTATPARRSKRQLHKTTKDKENRTKRPSRRKKTA